MLNSQVLQFRQMLPQSLCLESTVFREQLKSGKHIQNAVNEQLNHKFADDPSKHIYALALDVIIAELRISVYLEKFITVSAAKIIIFRILFDFPRFF